MSGSDVGAPGYRNALINNGTFTQNTIDINRGVLGGNGTVNGDVNLGGLDAILVGNGTFNGNVTIGDAISTETHPFAREHIAPGNSPGDFDSEEPGMLPGTLDINGDYTQLFDGIFEVDIGGYVPGDEYDWMDISGTAYLGGSLNVNLLDLGDGIFSPTLGDIFDILIADSISGMFDDLNMVSPLSASLAWDISYILDNTSNDIVRLSVVPGVPPTIPEPATLALFGIGLAGLGFARRRRCVKYTSTEIPLSYELGAY